MKQSRKTINPYARLADRPGKSPNMYTAWADGYKCGHNDGEMDERDDSRECIKNYSLLKGTVMDQARDIRHLTQELNVLRQSHKALDASNERLRNLRDTHDDVVTAFENDAEYLRATIKNIQAKNRVANDTIGMLRDADQRQQAWTTGNEAGYTDGLAEGKRQAEAEQPAWTHEARRRGFEDGLDEVAEMLEKLR